MKATRVQGSRISFTSKLVAAMLVAALVPLTVLALAALVYQQRTLTQRAMQQFSALAEVQQARVSSYLSGNTTSLALVTSRTQLRRSLAALADGADPERQRITDIIEDARASTAGITDIVVLDTSGTVAASTDPELLGEDWSAGGVATVARSEVSLHRVERAEDGELRNLAVGPLTLDGEVIGAIGVYFDFAPLIELVQDYTGLGATGETMLAEPRTDGAARYIAPLRFDQDATLDRRETLTDHSPMISAVQGVETTFTSAKDYRGADVIAVTRWLDEVGWGLVVKQDRSEVLAPVGTLRNGVLSAAALVALAGVVIAIVLARRLRTPVVELTKVSRSLASGDRTSRAVVRGRDELAELATVFNDMADQLMTEQDRLSQSVLERTQALSRALERIDRRNEDLENFTRVLAHDLNNPLAIARTFTRQLFEGSDPGQREQLELIERSLDRMRTLLKDVLAYLDSETSDLRSEAVDLADVVAWAVEEADADVEVETELPTVEGDEAMLRRVFVNLFSNSVKYARDGVPPKVWLRGGWRGQRWVVTVADNGIGIPDEDLESLFEPFRRGASVSERPGTGVGLAICRTVVERHGGDIRCVPSEDEGTVFEIELPATAPQPAHAG